MKLSVIIPIYNESENVGPLYSELSEELKKLANKKTISSYEIIFVNDGSKDKTKNILEQLSKKDKKLKAINLRRNFGQTAALKAGFDNSLGDLIVTMDGDLQNDPKDIERLIEKIKQGYDVVSGWRYKRHDSFGKRLSSRIMNNLRQNLIGDYLHDYGCALKIYKKECLKDLELFGELHRYITAYLYIKGYKIGEIKVNHRQRKFGKTKYKFNRGLNGILDLMFLKYWSSFSNRPLHLFGRLGIYQWILAAIIVIEQIVKAYLVKELAFGPLLALASMLGITGLITIIFGFLFEITSRTYFRDENIYSIKEIYN
ncbi:MAG: glycosyltransferase family 2 protein [Nanoarchaeota archaeon]|nr:glycosyltransferase family 2 protein [Nanoarchaeota archaeon]